MVGPVLPTGRSCNLDGTTIDPRLASMFFAQACDIQRSWTQVGAMLGLMLPTSKGAAGICGNGFVALAAKRTVMPDLPVAGIAPAVGVDRFMPKRTP